MPNHITLLPSTSYLGAQTSGFEGVCHASLLGTLVCCRLIRAHKNSYGALEDVGVFPMNEKGLEAVPNPITLFLSTSDLTLGLLNTV